MDWLLHGATMPIVITLYPKNERVDELIDTAQMLGMEVQDFETQDHGRCIILKGSASMDSLFKVLMVLD
jgi:hypothetical protein